MLIDIFIIASALISQRGTQPVRQIYSLRPIGDPDRAKELMKDPLPKDVVEETVSRYQELHRTLTAA